MRKKRLKSYVVPAFITSISVLVIVLTFLVTTGEEVKHTREFSYVSNVILGREVPVMDEKIVMVNPYIDEKVTIGKNFYDYKGTADKQEKSITYYDGTYIQNSGVDFVGEKKFDVISVLSGKVINVKEDDSLGKIIEIEHDKDFISIYQSLSEVNVKKDDIINQGQVIGTSGTNELDKELGNHLHFELLYKGNIVNPEEHLNKEI